MIPYMTNFSIIKDTMTKGLKVILDKILKHLVVEDMTWQFSINSHYGQLWNHCATSYTHVM